MSRRGRWTKILLSAAATLLILALPVGARPEERTVTGRIAILDPAAKTFTVTDGTGTGWNFKVARDAQIDLHALKVGDRVTVTISRATPRNMMSAADVLRKGDKVVPEGGY
jgi:hypothetical protein